MANDGTLSVDSAKLDDTLTNHNAAFQNFFQAAIPAGFAVNFSTDLSTLTDVINGVLNLNLTENKASQKTLSDTIQAFEDNLADRQKQLIAQYSRVDAMLRQLPLLLAQINSQLGAKSS